MGGRRCSARRPLHRRGIGAFLAALIVAVAGITFSPIRDYGFVNWDDDVYVTGNPVVQQPSPGAVSRVFTQFVSGNYHPLTVASYVAESALGGGARSFHLVNLALHLINAVLVMRLLTALGIPLAGAAIGALLWAVHPLRVEPVAWVSGRKDLLATLFSLASLLAYLRFRECGRRPAALGSVLLFALALSAKATAVVLPGLLLAIDWLQGRRITAAVIREKAPHLALAAIFSVLAVLARHSYQGVLDEQGFGWQQRVFQGTVRGAFYFLLRSVLPLTNPAWLYPEDPLPLLLVGRLAAAAALLAAVVGGALLALRRTRKPAFALLFFFVALSPVLPVAVLGYSADRFTYLPAVGIAYLVGEGAGWWAATPAARRLPFRLLGGAVLCLLVLLLARETRVRSAAWTDSEALWTAAIREYRVRGQGGANLAYALRYRARGRLADGRSARALEDYAEAARSDPQSADLRNEWGIALATAGEGHAAAEQFTAALEREPGSSAAAYNRGLVRLALGDAAGALADFSRALEADPANQEARDARDAMLAAGARAP